VEQSVTDPGLDRIFTVPNFLSLARVGLLAWALTLLFGANDRLDAAILLAIAGLTDFLDGYVARRFGQITSLGQVLDPTVDRLVLAGSVIAITVYGAIPVWVVAVLLGRELLVSGMGIALAALGAGRIDVLFIGKCATFGFMCAFPLFLVGDTSGTTASAVTDAAWIIVIPSLALSLLAAGAYVPIARRALDAGRRPSIEPGASA
jgi:cardiolipin synthase (CMP-forming)